MIWLIFREFLCCCVENDLQEAKKKGYELRSYCRISGKRWWWTKMVEVEEVRSGQFPTYFKSWKGKNYWWTEWVMWKKKEESGCFLVWGLNTMWMITSFTKVENTLEKVVSIIKIKCSVSNVVSLNYLFYNQVETFKQMSLKPLNWIRK